MTIKHLALGMLIASMALANRNINIEAHETYMRKNGPPINAFLIYFNQTNQEFMNLDIALEYLSPVKTANGSSNYKLVFKLSSRDGKIKQYSGFEMSSGGNGAGRVSRMCYSDHLDDVLHFVKIKDYVPEEDREPELEGPGNKIEVQPEAQDDSDDEDSVSDEDDARTEEQKAEDERLVNDLNDQMFNQSINQVPVDDAMIEENAADQLEDEPKKMTEKPVSGSRRPKTEIQAVGGTDNPHELHSAVKRLLEDDQLLEHDLDQQTVDSLHAMSPQELLQLRAKLETAIYGAPIPHDDKTSQKTDPDYPMQWDGSIENDLTQDPQHGTPVGTSSQRHPSYQNGENDEDDSYDSSEEDDDNGGWTDNWNNFNDPRW